VDWNSDGQNDIVSGDRSGYFNVFIRQDSVLAGYKQYRLMDSTIIDVGNNSQPTVSDWNGDGKKDLILGSENGFIYFYHNLGEDTWPMFQTYNYLDVEGNPINIYRVNPYVFDLDQDGLDDLICGGNDGYLRFYRNIGTNTNPRLAQSETLKTVDGTRIRPPGVYTYGSRCGFGFWNGDTVPDFLISGYEGTVALYLGEPMVGVKEEHRLSKPVAISVRPVVGRPPFSIAVLGDKQPGTTLTIFDAAGRTVQTLSAANTAIIWDGNDRTGKRVPAGIYICRIDRSNTESATLILTK